MKKNNNNQILYLSLPLYGKFTYKGHFGCRKDQGGEDRESKPEQ